MTWSRIGDRFTKGVGRIITGCLLILWHLIKSTGTGIRMFVTDTDKSHAGNREDAIDVEFEILK